ncbi:MAG: hypothetical protein FDZ75_05615 [Actinobacteria bacterium]|nr:MAG: hypothetical protein FDZ75_05615 [Actinomycetota bacterium]
MLYGLRALYRPAMFQGAHRRDRYFEGWYFKCVDSSVAHPIAVIPGISLDRAGGSSHAFIQVIRPGGRVKYMRFPVEAFDYSPDRFEIRIGDNRFSEAGFHLELPPGDGITESADDGIGAIAGDVRFGELSCWPVTLLSPGVMGWYRYVPRMECYHGVVSMDHALDGGLTVGGQTLSFLGGRGYAEKDWGTSFPSSWIWAQSNHFCRDGRYDPGVSVMVSVAKIPWLGSSFIGHLAGVLVDGELHRFATYTGAKLTTIETGNGCARVALDDGAKRLEISFSGATTGPLKAPRQGAMSGVDEEALGTELAVHLERKESGVWKTVFRGVGEHAGVEVSDPAGELAGDL